MNELYESSTGGLPPRVLGFVGCAVPDSFLDGLPEEELAAWEG